MLHCMYVFISKCMYVAIFNATHSMGSRGSCNQKMYVCMFICIYVCLYVCMYVYMYVSMYVHGVCMTYV